jgi:Leucine-rich repeat (LRR) protein
MNFLMPREKCGTVLEKAERVHTSSGIKSNRWWALSTILILSFILISASSVDADTLSAPETEVGQASEEEVNACNFHGAIFMMFCYCDTDTSIEVVKCNSWGLSEIPEKQPWTAIGDLETVTYLQLNNRPERSLNAFPPRSMFSSLNKLVFFSSKSCEFELIPSYAFANSSTISELVLNGNWIRTLAPKAFANMNSLHKVSLESNHISEINRDVFTNLPSLVSLYLDGNEIQVIHDNAFKDLSRLTELGLKKNNLTNIAREVFSGLNNLVRLDLHSNSIEFLGDHVFANMPRLQDLDLHGNQIRSISPSAFHGLKNLGRISLMDNKIVTLDPPIFSHMKRIYMIDLRDNALETLSEDVVEPIYSNLLNVSMQLMIAGMFMD